MDFALVAFEGVDRATEVFATGRDDSGGASRWQEQVGLVEHHTDGHLVMRGTFAGHYVDIDEASRTSEAGAAEGWKRGALTGLLLTPAGFAVGSVLGAVIGSQEGDPSEREREPTLLADRLRAVVPAPGSGIVLVADADVVQEMLDTLELRDAHVTRGTLDDDEQAVLDVALSDEPVAASSGGGLVDAPRGPSE